MLPGNSKTGHLAIKAGSYIKKGLGANTMVFDSKKGRETAIPSVEPFWLVSWLGGQ